MARIAENTMIIDGQEYKPGDVIPDFKSIKCVDTREPRKYQGLSADVSVLNDVIAKYASGGASCFMSDTGEYYEYDREEKTWKLITNITERGFDSEKSYGVLKHMLKNFSVSDEKIQSAVTDYLVANPVLPGATTEQAQQIEQNKTDITSLKTETSSLKEDIYNQVEKTLSNNEFDWQSGWYESDGTIHNHEYFKHSKVFKTVRGSTITFKNLRAPANYIACIACFSGTRYVHGASLKGEAYTAFSSGTFTVPENIDGVSFISYVDGLNEITAKLITVEVKSDSHEEKI